MNSRAITPFVPPSVPKAKDQPRAADTKTDATTNNEVTPTPDSKDLALEKLRVNELKTKLTNTWGKYKRAAQRTMGPFLYHLRKKLKAQGKSSAGFGAWVEDNVDISRRTADRWADEYALGKGLMKPRKHKAPTFGQLSKSSKATPSDGNVPVPLSFVFRQDEADKFLAAMKVLGDKAQAIIYNAVTTAADRLVGKKASQPEHNQHAERVGTGR